MNSGLYSTSRRRANSRTLLLHGARMELTPRRRRLKARTGVSTRRLWEGERGSNCGTVYRINSAGFTPLQQFDNIHGCQPVAPLVLATDGIFRVDRLWMELGLSSYTNRHPSLIRAKSVISMHDNPAARVDCACASRWADWQIPHSEFALPDPTVRLGGALHCGRPRRRRRS